MQHAYGKDVVSAFNKELEGFFIRVHTPAQALRMHDALRALDDGLPEGFDVSVPRTQIACMHAQMQFGSIGQSERAAAQRV